MDALVNSPVAKKSIKLSLPVEVMENARSLKLNLSCELETHLRSVIREKLSAQWRIENREAIQETNREVARDGLWSDGLRMF